MEIVSMFNFGGWRRTLIFILLLVLLVPGTAFSPVFVEGSEEEQLLSAPGPETIDLITFSPGNFGETIITTWLYNQTSALSITYDDATPNQAHIAAPEMTSRGLVGTFFLAVVDVSNWAWWQNVSNHGHELGSHTVNHVDLETKSIPEIEFELGASRRFIEENVSGAQVDTFCYPFGSGADNNTMIDFVKQYYISARRVWHLDYNPNTITWLYQVRPSYFFEATSASTMNGYLNETINNSGWAVEMLHGIVDSSDGYQPIPVDNLTAHLNFVKQKKDEGKVWVDTFGNVSKYISERLNATINYSLEPGEGNITVNFTTPLNTTVYDVPLTLRTRIPDNWTTAFLIFENGTILELDPRLENGKSYVYYTVPDRNQSLRVAETLMPVLLDHTGEVGYTDSFFQPGSGSSQQLFSFRLNVTSLDNIPPANNSIFITFDLTGDGDTDDNISGFFEGAYPMLQFDVNDTIYTDGKIFVFNTTFPPGSKPSFRFDSIDTYSRNISMPEGATVFLPGPEINNAPQPVYGFLIQDLHDWTPRLNWNSDPDPDGDPIYYNISVGSSPNSTDVVPDTNLSSKYLDITSRLIFNTDYWVTIRSRDQRGLTSNYSYYSFKLNNDAPASPTNLNVDSNQTLEPMITWSNSSDTDNDPIRYDLYGYQMDFNGTGYEINLTNNMITALNATDAYHQVAVPFPDNSTIHLNLSAKDQFNATSAAATGEFHFNIPPPKIMDITAVPSSTVSLAVELNWSIDANNITDWRSYRIYRGQVDFDNLSSGAVLIAEFMDNKFVLNLTDAPLVENVTYYYAVVAVDYDGDHVSSNLTTVSSKPGDDLSIPPELPPPPLTGVSAADVVNASNSISVTWDPSNAANTAGYRIYRSLSTIAYLSDILLLTILADKNATPVFIDNTVLNNITYFYAVSAYSSSALENKSTFQLAWAVSIYDINPGEDEPKDPVNISKGDDPLYDSTIDIASGISSDLMNGLNSLNTGDPGEGLGYSADDVDDHLGKYSDDTAGYHGDPVITIIDIEAEPPGEEPQANNTIDDNKTIDDDEPDDPGNGVKPDDEETGSIDSSSSLSSLTKVVLILWITVLAITVLMSVMYLKGRKAASEGPDEQSTEFEEE